MGAGAGVKLQVVQASLTRETTWSHWKKEQSCPLIQPGEDWMAGQGLGQLGICKKELDYQLVEQFPDVLALKDRA